MAWRWRGDSPTAWRLRSFLSYYKKFFGVLLTEVYDSWRKELYSAVAIAVITFFITRLEVSAKHQLYIALEACGIWLGLWILWHLIRTPWLVHEKSLDARAFALCKEITRFMDDLGPMVYDTGPAAMQSGQQFQEVNKHVIEREEKMDAGFQRRYALRVIDIYNEFCENGVVDRQLETMIGKNMTDPDIVKEVIKRLRDLAAAFILKQQRRER